MNRVVTDSATGEQIIIQEEFVPYHQHLLMKVWIENP